jgi:hypothetical protein
MADLFDVAESFEGHGSRHTCYSDPVGWAESCIRWRPGEGLTDYQREILAAIPVRRRVSVRGLHGLGKSALSAIAVLWFGSTRELSGVDWKVPTTAGSWRQLTHYLWPEIAKWARRIEWDALGCRPWSTRDELMALTLRLGHGQAFAAASDRPELLEGAHADSILYVFDESKSIASATFDAAEGALGGQGEAFALALSTPGEPSGRFFEIHARRSGLEDWWARHVSLEEAVEAGRVSRSWVAQRRRQWGESSAVFQNRVLGEFASADEDGVIPLGWVEAANERWRAWADAGRPAVDGVVAVGVDVARSGSDRTVLAVRAGDVVTELRRSSREDTMQTTGRVVGLLGSLPGAVAVVDVIGVGGGVVDRLRELGLKVSPFNASESSDRKDRSGELGFVNLRAAAWWRLRELLDPAYGPALALPPDDSLIGDLTAPHWRVTSAGKIQIESKDDVRARIGRSTDDGDAVVMACWLGVSGGMTHRAWVDFLTRQTVRNTERATVAKDPARADERTRFRREMRRGEGTLLT